jgi:hypothetical protein
MKLPWRPIAARTIGLMLVRGDRGGCNGIVGGDLCLLMTEILQSLTQVSSYEEFARP